MIGFYSYTVILTYLGLASAALGMMLTFNGFARYALFCLAFSGLCDMFDGKVARTKANRTEDEKRFGIQIDSLCDVVCFGAFPMILCYSMGMRGIAGICILVFYLTAGVIRLAFFNVMEERRQDETDEADVYKRQPLHLILSNPLDAEAVFYIFLHLKPGKGGILLENVCYVMPL